MSKKPELTTKVESAPAGAKNLNKSFEKEITKAITDTADDNDFVMELEEEDWGNPSQLPNGNRASVLNLDTNFREVSVSKNGTDENEIEITEENVEEIKTNDTPKAEEKRERVTHKQKTVLLKTIMAELHATEKEKFSIQNWVELQELFKSNLFVAESEFSAKTEAIKRLKGLLIEYVRLHLSVREKNEMLQKKRNHESYKEEELAKVLPEDQSHILGLSEPAVKDLLYLVYENPKIVALLAKHTDNMVHLKALEETFAMAFYENILSEDDCDFDALKLFTELLRVELNHTQKPADLLHPDHFFNKMWAAYLKRTECKNYIKTVLREPLLACIKEKARIRIDAKEVKVEVEKRRRKIQKNSTSTSATSTTPSSANNSILGGIFSKSQIVKPSPKASDTKVFFKKEAIEGSLSRILSNSREENEGTVPPKFIPREAKSVDKNGRFDDLKASEASSFEMKFDVTSPLRIIEDREVAHILEKNFNLLKKYLTVLIRSIFENLENMPMGLRVLCKIIHTLIKKKFPNLQEKESTDILGNYLFRKWICPNYVSPAYNGILEDFESSPDLAYNLVEITKALQSIFSMSLYPTTDIKSELNDYIRELIPSVQKYYKELISVNEDSLQEVLQGKTSVINKLKTKSICISLYEVKVLCECIIRQKEELSKLYPTLIPLVEKIQFYDQTGGIFSNNVDVHLDDKMSTVKPSQVFLLFHDIVFPEHLISDYIDEFKKMPGFSKTLPDEEKALVRSKHCVKSFLLEIKDIKNMLKWAAGSDFTLDDVLERYSDKPYCVELNSSKRGDRVPVHISARFLSSLLVQIPSGYRVNNYFKFHQETLDDFKKLAESLDNSISTNKMQLSKGQKTIMRKCDYLQEVQQERNTILKRANIWEFIRSLKIPMCITSPSTMERFLKDKNNGKKGGLVSDKIEIILRSDKGCIHEKISIMRELTISAGAIAIGNVKPKAAGSGSFAGSNGAYEDNKYHIETVDEFIHLFGNLHEVKQAIVEGKDRYGVNNAIVFFYNQLYEEIKNKNKYLDDEELRIMMDEIESYVCKRLYYHAFPPIPSEADKRFWKKCKVLEWVNFDHLEIIPRNRYGQMWEYAAKVLNQIDNRLTPIEKLECIMECFKTITQVLDLASAKEGAGGADDTLPIMIYTILKACPKRIHSNLNFIEMFRDSKKMLAGEGYCFIQASSAVMSLLNVDHNFFKMDKKNFDELIRQKEEEYDLIDKN